MTNGCFNDMGSLADDNSWKTGMLLTVSKFPSRISNLIY